MKERPNEQGPPAPEDESLTPAIPGSIRERAERIVQRYRNAGAPGTPEAMLPFFPKPGERN